MSAPVRDEARVLVTGAAGFVGRAFLAQAAEVQPSWRFDTPAAEPEAGAPGLDIADARAVSTWMRENRPDVVVHLAAVAAVTASDKDPRLAWDVNLGGTLNLVLALAEWAPQAHMLYVSSSEVYGASFADGAVVDETSLLQPVNPYAASKAAADILVRQAGAAGLSFTVMRPFNQTGPGQAEAFALPSFAAQIARIEAGLQPPVLAVGALDEERDFLDVRDVTRAYWSAIAARDGAANGAVFNVCAERSRPIGEHLETLLSLARVPIEVRQDPARLRRSPLPTVRGSSARLRESLGWSPVHDFKATLEAVLVDARRRVGADR